MTRSRAFPTRPPGLHGTRPDPMSFDPATPERQPPHRRRCLAGRRAVGCLAAIASLVLLSAAASPRHTELDATSPGADAVSHEAVGEVVLTFTTPVNDGLSRIVVMRAAGDTVFDGMVEHPPGREDQLRATPDAPLGSGAYQVSWRALSPDGHVVEGEFGFRVDTTAQTPPAGFESDAQVPGPASDAAGSGTVSGSETASRGVAVRTTGGPWIRWMHLLGTVLLLGAVGARFGVLPTTGFRASEPEARARMVRGFSRFGWLAAVLLLVALPLQLVDQLSALGAEAGIGDGLVLLFETAWGAGWLVHLGVVTLAVFGLTLASPGGQRDRGWVVLTLAALVLPLVSALQGHAWIQGESRELAVLSLYLHVLGSGLWLGGLVLLVLVGLPALERARRKDVGAADELEEDEEAPLPKPALVRLVNAFSRVALPAAVLVIVSGAVNAWIELGGPGPLIGSAYGRTLLVKLAFVAAAMCLGYYNWRRVRPILTERPRASTLRIPASVEALLGVVILFVTAVLVATPAP